MARFIMSHDLSKLFTYHKPKPGQPEIYQEIRDKAKEFAILINNKCLDGDEKCIAIEKLQEVVMWANAGIARS